MKKYEMPKTAQLKVDLRNKTAMYHNAKERNDVLKEEIKTLKNEKLELQNIIASQKDELEKMRHTIDEYKRMIFRPSLKKKGREEERKVSNKLGGEPVKRAKESYTRKTPPASKITHTREARIERCPICKNPLVNKKEVERLVEDISFKDQTSKVTRYIIHSGYCKFCKKQRSLEHISNTVTTLGENVRMFVNFSFTVLKLSYDTIKVVLKTLYGFEISDGEIRNILQREAEVLMPEYNQIKQGIQKQFGVHFDESSWQVATEKERNYAWCMTGTENRDVIYDLGIGRGGGEVDILGGVEENKLHVGITDGYAGYTNKFEEHQMCWAHPHRKFRDLTESKGLEKAKLQRCQKTYELFAQLYSQIREEIEKEQARIERGKASSYKQREKLKERLQKELLRVAKIHKDDPKKLITYKTSLEKNKDKYFVCILHPGIPADNNKAERALRHLVLKRKMCNGSKTKEAASFMGINYSVLLTTFWRHPLDFFEDYSFMRELFFKDPTIDEKFRRELKI